jgi:hypothetical protein
MSQTRTQYSKFYKVKLDFDSWLVISGALNLKLDIDIESVNFKFKPHTEYSWNTAHWIQ